jgi:prephenate dehydrogenase
MTRYGRVALIGTGHIGGSLALAMRGAGVAGEVVGYDHAPGALAEAQRRCVVDAVAGSAVEAVTGAELVVLAVPVGAVESAARAIAPALGARAWVHDVGSTKVGIVRALEPLVGADRFIGGHPLAGTESSGPGAADGALFRGRVAFVTPTAATAPEVRAAAQALWRAVGAQPLEMDAAAHDALMAAVSHLPHVVAYALVATVAASGDAVAGLAAGGFRDTTRIALANRQPVLDMLDRFSSELGRLRALVERGDGPGLEAELARLRAARARVLG